MRRHSAVFLITLLALSAAIVWLCFSLLADWRRFALQADVDPRAAIMAALIALSFGGVLVMLLRIWRACAPAARQSVVPGRVVMPAPPAGFAREYIARCGVGFCYPLSWRMTRSFGSRLYAEFQEQEAAPGCSSRRNFNIACQSIAGVRQVNLLFDEIVRGGRGVFPQSEMVCRAPFRRGQLRGFNYRLQYYDSGRAMTCWQWGVTTRQRRTLVIMTFTMRTEDGERSRELVNRVISSIVIRSASGIDTRKIFV